MTDNVVAHPHRELMAEARHERELADSPEAEVLQEAIDKSVRAYSEFLEQHGLIWDHNADPDLLRLKAQALIVTLDYGSPDNAVDITLKDGPLDRVYGNGINPDPWELGPPDIPHKPRADD